MELLVRRVQNVHVRTPGYIRKRLEATALETWAERSAAVWQLAQEIKLAVPISDAVIKREWLDAWAEGSDHIDTEIQVAQGWGSDSKIMCDQRAGLHCFHGNVAFPLAMWCHHCGTHFSFYLWRTLCCFQTGCQ